MDLSDIFKDPRAKAKQAEALQILHLARQTGVDEWNSAYGYVSEEAKSEYRAGKRAATRLLFNWYSKAVFDGEENPDAFIGLLPEIRGQVDRDLQVEYDGENPVHKGRRIVRIDFHEAEGCELEWKQRAWDRASERAKRTFLGSMGEILNGLLPGRASKTKHLAVKPLAVAPDPEQHKKPSVPMEQGDDVECAARAQEREDWITKMLAGRPLKYITDDAIGPSGNTLRRYRSGEKSNQDGTVRGQLAQVFKCNIDKVPR